MLANSRTRYGAIARTLHWTVAILILTTLILGVVGQNIPRSADNIQLLTTLYSTHKTVGLTVLGLALIRVGWALTQPRPVPLHPERRLETFAAETAHWLLYAALFILPLSGWVMHAAEDGFAPIWWPFGQTLPFVPKSESWAQTAGAIHWASGLLLGLTLAAHIAGALKHAIIDRDSTLSRMCFNVGSGDETLKVRHGPSMLAGGAIWVAVLGLTLASFGLPGGTDRAASAAQPVAATADPAATGPVWTTQSVDLSFTVIQLGSEVTGHFETAPPVITYDPGTGTGRVTVTIDMTSVTLGSVTDQAKGSDFFDIANHPTAVFEAEISRVDGDDHLATGTLTLIGNAAPVEMPFTLTLDGDTATMVGSIGLDRRDFDVGATYADESSVGFAVGVNVMVTATQP